MLKINLINALYEPFPEKCHILNSFLESPANSKSLYDTFELLVDFIFSNTYINASNSLTSTFSDINNNNSRTVYGATASGDQFIRPPATWPLKLINKTQYDHEHECIFNFLSTNSPLWLAIFRLDNLGSIFNVSCNSLPTNVRQRIENGQSYFSSKSDAFNVLSLTALEFFLFYFLLSIHDTRTSSRRIYDETFGNIELDSLYGDLLTEYLHFFLPLHQRNVNFPSFSETTSNNKSSPNVLITQASANNNTKSNRCYYGSHTRHHHTSLLKQVVQKSASIPVGAAAAAAAAANGDDEDTNSLLNNDESFSLLTPDSNRVFTSKAAISHERAANIKKVDTFLRIINELLVLPFSTISLTTSQQHHTPIPTGSVSYNNPSPAYTSTVRSLNPYYKASFQQSFSGNSKTTSTTSKSSFNPGSFLSSSLLHPTSSPTKYNDSSKQSLANMECVFALSMILKHSHLFVNAFQVEIRAQPVVNTNINKANYADIRQRYGGVHYANDSWPIDELRTSLFQIYWRKSFYKFFEFHMEHLSITPNLKWFLEVWLAYIQPWKFDIAVVNEASDRTLLSYAYSSNQKAFDFIKENFPLFSDIYHLVLRRYCIGDLANVENLQMIYQILNVFSMHRDEIKKCNALFLNAQCRLIHQSRHECQQLLKHNHDIRLVFNLLTELDKPLHMFKSFNSGDNLKMIASFYENLTSSKNSLLAETELRAQTKSRSIWRLIRDSLFSDKQDNQMSKLSTGDIEQTVQSIETCLDLIQMFYQPEVNFEEFVQLLNQTPPNLDNSSNEELKIQNGFRLTPQDRFKLIHGLKKPVFVRHYDPCTAPVGEMEIGILVFIMSLISNVINNTFSDELTNAYTRDDFLGKLVRRVLYLPESVADEKNYHQQAINVNGSLLTNNATATLSIQPRLSLRKLASYQFLVYFFVSFLFLKLCTGYSYMGTLMLDSLLFFFFALVFKN